MRVLSLFDGISCGQVAFERAKIKVKKYYAYEIDKYAIEITQANYSDTMQMGDVTKEDFTKYKGKVDIVIGGSPCTYWSVAKPTTRETTSTGIGYELFSHFVRAVKESGAKYFLYENNNSISKEIKQEISKDLGVEFIMINSSLVSAQERNRCYWTNIPGVQQPEDKKIYFKDVIDKYREDWRPVGKWTQSNWAGYGKKKIDRLKTFEAEKANTLTTSKTHSFQYYVNEDRTMYSNLRVCEFELLQTLPQGYCRIPGVPETQMYKGIGNGWTVDVIAHIFSYIPRSLEYVDNINVGYPMIQKNS